MCPKSSRPPQHGITDDKTISVSSLTGMVDNQALDSFFRELIERRYYSAKAASGTDLKKQFLIPHCQPPEPQVKDDVSGRIDSQSLYSIV